MDNETYTFFYNMLKEKIENYEKGDLYSFFTKDSSFFSFFISINYFLLIKDFIIKKDINNPDINMRLSLEALESDLNSFMKENIKYITQLKTASNNNVYIIDTIRDSILHNGCDIDLTNGVVHINNSLKSFSCDIDFNFFKEFLFYGFYDSRVFKEKEFILPISNREFYEKLEFNSDFKKYDYIYAKNSKKNLDRIKFLKIRIKESNNKYLPVKSISDVFDKIRNNNTLEDEIRKKIEQNMFSSKTPEEKLKNYEEIVKEQVNSPLTVFQLWNLKCKIKDLITNFTPKNFNNYIFENKDNIKKIMDKYIELLQAEINSRNDFNDFFIEIEEFDDKDYINKIINTKMYEKENIEKNDFNYFCNYISGFFLRHVFDTQENLLMCMHDICTSINQYKIKSSNENNNITKEISKAILQENSSVIDIKRIRRKYGLISKDEYDYKKLSFNSFLEYIREYKKNCIRSKYTQKELDKIKKMRDYEYNNNVLTIESRDENYILNILQKENLSKDEITLKKIKEFAPSLYEKYYNKILNSDETSEEDLKLFFGNQNDLLEWSNVIKDRLFFYDNTNQLLFLYLIGCGIYSINKDNSNFDNEYSIENIKSYSRSSYNRFYNSIILPGPRKRQELQNKLNELINQYNNCNNEKGKEKIEQIIERVRKELLELDNQLNRSIKNIDGENYLEDNKEDTLRIIRNCFSHLGRIEIEDLQNLEIILRDKDEDGNISAIIKCNLKDLLNIFKIKKTEDKKTKYF